MARGEIQILGTLRRLRCQAGQRLRCGRQDKGLNAFLRALRGGIKDAQAIDLIAKEFDAHRCSHVGWENVDEAPTTAEGAWFVYDCSGSIAVGYPTLQCAL